MSHPEKAAVNRRLVKRVIIFSTILVVLGIAYWWLSNNKDWDFGAFNSVGDVAAIQSKNGSSQAVIIKADGSILESPDYTSDPTRVPLDRDITWSADGNRVFFMSDRNKGQSHIFRWNPGTNKVEQRSTDDRTKGQLSFYVPGSDKPSDTALMTAGGIIFEFDPKDGVAKQVLPPRSKDEAGQVGKETSQGMFDEEYQALGKSFKSARWGKDKNYIFAVMRRDDGELLVMKDMTNAKEIPIPLAAADHIEFDVDKDGRVAYTLTNFQFPDPKQIPPEYIKKGKVVLPYKYFVFLFDPSDKKPPVLVTNSNSDQATFNAISFSPDGQNLAITVAKYAKGEGSTPLALVKIPASEGAARAAVPLAKGEIYDITWNPNGDTIAYTKKAGGTVGVFTVHKDGTGEVPLTKEGDFSQLSYSPQVAAK